MATLNCSDECYEKFRELCNRKNLHLKDAADEMIREWIKKNEVTQ